MSEPNIAAYGAWKSPISSDLIVASTIALGEIQLDGDNIYWCEGRPTEGGRNVIVRRSADGAIVDMTPAGFNARTTVHEYGGGAFTVEAGVLYFSNFTDQRLYRQTLDAPPQPITPAIDMRYADGVIDRRRGRMICVREDHTGAGEAVNTIVALPLDGGGEAVVLAQGYDFYSTPRLSPDGAQLAWLAWNHPNMPWDGTELWCAKLMEQGLIDSVQLVAGGIDESIFQPAWSPAGVLHFVSDRTGWWNLYRWRATQVEALHPLPAEFGLPQWVFGMATYGFESADRIICIYGLAGIDQLALLDTASGTFEAIETPYNVFAYPQSTPGKLVVLAGSATENAAVVRIDLATRQVETLRRASELTVDPGYISVAQATEFPTEAGLTAHGLFYAPHNADYRAPANTRPPLLVMSHGGPTSAATAGFDLEKQFWTSRGIAVLDVNYGGSTGYGRAYRQRLNDQWGIVDMNDCANGALYLAKLGTVDRDRLAITGGSAGGYTTLCALVFRDEFSAGASYYGISDLAALAQDTHKFESRYMDRLIGPYPERKDLYYQRSPIHYSNRLECPIILFQGLEDKVVPPSQAQLMVDALRAKGLPVAYVAFEGEQHGFRQAENIKRALDGEFYFYQKYLLGLPVELPDYIQDYPPE